jgi:hypothetical protein
MSIQEVFEDSRAVQAELVLALVFAGLIIGGLTFTDIRIHDFYVREIIAECYPQNQTPFCAGIRELHELPKDAHMELGNIYWQILLFHAIWVSVLMGFIRFSFLILSKRKFTGTRIFMIFLWGITASAFFFGGFLDIFYYTSRNMEIPDTLEWLDNSGLFVLSKQLGDDPLHVERNDLFITAGLTFGFLFALWILEMSLYSKEGLRGAV